jgi:hypothetical protein
VPEDLPPAWGPHAMRASDADRERVADALRAAAGDGRLTAEEFDQRLEAVWSSRTVGELHVLTADLGSRAPAAGRIAQRGGSVNRTGRWVVPRRLELRTSWCDVSLDFTDAVITHDTLDIDLNMRGGSLLLVSPPGTVVDADALAVRYADVDLPGPGAQGTLRVQLAGRMRYGWIGLRQAG